MPKEATLVADGFSIAYTLKKVRRSRHIRISVYQDGRVVITAPYYETYKRMERFLRENKSWIAAKIQAQKNKKVVAPGGDKNHYKKHKKEARLVIQEKLDFFNEYYKFPYARVSIRNQKTRWGSCSEHGNLNFSYKILFLPKEAADYIIVHELCHLKEMNHSRHFWNLVAETIPNYRAIRKNLKQQIV